MEMQPRRKTELPAVSALLVGKMVSRRKKQKAGGHEESIPSPPGYSGEQLRARDRPFCGEVAEVPSTRPVSSCKASAAPARRADSAGGRSSERPWARAPLLQAAPGPNA